MLPVKWIDLSRESNLSVPIHLILLFKSMLYFSLCLFVVVFFFPFFPPTTRVPSRTRPTPPPRLVCCQTSSHVKSQKPRQVTKTGPDFSAHQLRCHHNGQFLPAWPREQEKKRDGKSEIGTMPKHILLQDLSWFGVLLDTLHFLFDW